MLATYTSRDERTRDGSDEERHVGFQTPTWAIPVEGVMCLVPSRPSAVVCKRRSAHGNLDLAYDF